MELPLREQGTLLTAVRGCDLEPKQWTAMGFSDSPGRRLTAFIRYCFMVPADVREVDIPGAFFQSAPPVDFKPSEFGHLPLHWYTHVMHALEIITYRHPSGQGVHPGSPQAEMQLADTPAVRAWGLYSKMVHGLHLNTESHQQMVERLSEDRIIAGTVVS